MMLIDSGLLFWANLYLQVTIISYTNVYNTLLSNKNDQIVGVHVSLITPITKSHAYSYNNTTWTVNEKTILTSSYNIYIIVF